MSKKKIAVHKYTYETFAEKWIDAINASEDFEAKVVNLFAVDAIEQVKDCDGVMWHFAHVPLDKQCASKVLTAIEKGLGIPVWPNFDTRWHFDEKVGQHYLFKSTMNDFFIPSWVFWNYDDAKEFLENTNEYPFVFKLSVGAGSVNVFKVNNKEEALESLRKMMFEGIFPYTENEYKVKNSVTSFSSRIKKSIKYVLKNKLPPLPLYYQLQKDYFYLQKFLPGNENDIRITVIGNRAFGYIRYNRKDDFRASGSGNFNVDPKNIPLEAVKIAHEFSQRNNFQSMAYDFLLDVNGKPLLNEISYGYVAWMVHDCPGYWDRDLKWHDGQMWPEYAHVEDFLNKIRDRCIL